MAVIVLKSAFLIEQVNAERLATLEKDFIDLKSGIPVDTFGKDVPYDHINTLPSVKAEELWHVHIIGINDKFKRFVKQEDKTSDNHLVYCSNYFNSAIYLLIAILEPDAHELAKKNQLMLKLVDIAKTFRNEQFKIEELATQ